MVTKSILSVFAHSPIKPLEKHMDKVQSCVSEITAYFEAVLAKRWDQVEILQKKIAQLEHEADELKRDLRLHLPKSLLLPVARSDLLELLSMQDRVANKAKDIAGIILGRKMTFPEALVKDLPTYVADAVKTTELANKAISELDELLETGFSGNLMNVVDKMIKELADVEHRTDEQQIKLRRALYEIEKDLPPVDVIFYYKIIEWIGDLADRAQKVGDRLQILLAR